MKKILSIVLVVLMHISLVGLIGCDSILSEVLMGKELKFGLGVSASYGEMKSATNEADGSGEAVVDVAAVLVDAKGRIVKCTVDCASSTVSWTNKGKAVASAEFKTKAELGDDYNMVAWGGAVQEWYKQAESFEKMCEGKTIDEVKAMVIDGYKPNEELVNAGCTIAVSGFVGAVEKAVANVIPSNATEESVINIGVQTSATPTDTTQEADGNIEVTSSVVAVVIDENKLISQSTTDVATVKFTFNSKGENTTYTDNALNTKREAGENYGMSQYGQDLNGDGVVKEWFQQADAFDAALVGKKYYGIVDLATEIGYGSGELQTAGCTIHIGDMQKAAVKAYITAID